MLPLRLPRIAAIAALGALLALQPAFAQQGVDADTITLGHSGALSGPVSELNKEYLSGAKLHFDQVNARGGIHGRRIRLLTLDDAYDPELAAANVRKLIERHRVFALFGCFGTGPSLKTIPLASAAGVPFFAPYSGADALRQPVDPHVFHLRASYRQEIDKIVGHLATLGVRSVGIVHHADPFGETGLETAVAALSRRGITPSVLARFGERDADAGDAARIVAGANPAAVIMIAAHDHAAAFVRALRSTGYRPMLFGLSIINADQLVRELGDQAYGLVVARVLPSPFRLDYPFVRDYRYFSDKAKLGYSYPALEGYLAATVFTEALRRAGRDLNAERFLTALEGMTDWDAGGLKLQYSTHNHVGLDYVDLTVIGRGDVRH